MASWFGRKERGEEAQSFWTHMSTNEQLEQVIERSEIKAQVIFKHSTRCIISKMVLRNFEDTLMSPNKEDYHLLDLIANREVSNVIATELGVYHQSPQLIIVHKKKAVYDRSHHSISSEEVEAFIQNSLT